MRELALYDDADGVATAFADVTALAEEARFDILAPERLADLSPNYVRAVSAKTIQERLKDSIDRGSGID